MTLDDVAGDLRRAVRTLRAQPLYSLASILILAVGIGAATTVFTFVDGLILRPLPVSDPDRLVRIWKIDPVRGFDHFPLTYSEYLEWSRRASSLDSMAATWSWGPWTGVLENDDDPVPVRIEAVSSNYFDVLGVGAARGRAFLDSDEAATTVVPVVLSWRLWKSRFGGDPAIVGSKIPLRLQRATSFEAVGVLPFEFELGARADAWVPALALHPEWTEERGCECDVIARRKSSATLPQVEVELQAIHDRMARESPGDYRSMRVSATPLLESVVGEAGRVSLLLLGAAVTLLLIAAFNLAALALVRGAERRRQTAIQQALGASRLDLVRQGAVEGLLLAVVGLAGAIGLAHAAVRTTLWLKGADIPRIGEISFGARPILFSLAALGAVFLVTTLYPAVRAAREDFTGSIQGRSKEKSHRLSRPAVVAQIALAVVLLVGAGLLLQTLDRQQSIEIGVVPEDLFVVGVRLAESRYSSPESRLQLLERLVEALEAVPGVSAATPLFMKPGAGWSGYSAGFVFEGQSPEEARSNPMASFEMISPDYFRTLGIPLLHGRAFDEADRERSARVVIVSAATAARYWPGEDALEKEVRVEGMPPHRVVGVAADTRYRERTRSWHSVYFPLRQSPFSTEPGASAFAVPGLLAVRTTGDPDAVLPALRGTMARIDVSVPRGEIETMASLLDRELSHPRFNALATSLFSALAALLAAAGLHAFIATSVARRRAEFGLRLALGATPACLLAMVLGESSRLVALGIATGIAGAWVLSGSLRPFVFEVNPVDFATYAAVSSGVALVALAATSLPARRASRCDPLELLKSE